MLRGQDLASFLKEIRKNAGLSQKEVADTLGYKSSQFVSNWERGLSSPPLTTLRRLARLYRIAENEMFSRIRDIAVRELEDELRKGFYNDTLKA